MKERITRKQLLRFAPVLVLLVSAACRQDMHDQPKYKLYRESHFAGYQKDKAASRQLPENTVARGHLNADKVFYTGREESAAATPAATPTASQTTDSATTTGTAGEFKGFTANFPMKVTQEVLDRGQNRFNIYCTPCHGVTGAGNGMVVQRGFKTPTSYYEERLKTAPVGYLYDVITNGFGAMQDYSAQLTPQDRWAVVAYIRALQKSKGVKADELTPEQKKQLASANNHAAGKGEGK